MISSARPWTRRIGRGLMRPTTSAGLSSSRSIPVRRSASFSESAVNGSRGWRKESLTLGRSQARTSDQAESTTTALSRGSRAAAMIAVAPPIEKPKTPSLSRSTSGLEDR